VVRQGIDLMHRKIPLQFLGSCKLIQQMFACIWWNNTLFSAFQLCYSVRQTGVVSHVSFTLYVNNIIEDLQQQDQGFSCLHNVYQQSHVIVLGLSSLNVHKSAVMHTQGQ